MRNVMKIITKEKKRKVKRITAMICSCSYPTLQRMKSLPLMSLQNITTSLGGFFFAIHRRPRRSNARDSRSAEEVGQADFLDPDFGP